MKTFVLFLYFSSLLQLISAQEVYTLGTDSKLAIAGTSTVHDWTVTANTMAGTLLLVGDAPKEIDFQVTVADIKSERGSTMDKKMHAALRQETNPNVHFELKEVKNESSAIGMLSMAGKKQEVEIPVQMIDSQKNFKISGEYPINLRDWDIEPPTAMFGQVIVGDDVRVKFDLVFLKQ